jgi:hypothetical protein
MMDCNLWSSEIPRNRNSSICMLLSFPMWLM